jgi:hypothetical protein
VRLDLGATAKALAADRTAHAVHEATGSGVLVSLATGTLLAGEIDIPDPSSPGYQPTSLAAHTYQDKQ